MTEFGVDLRGVIDLLSRHIYSGPEVYLRELLQNSRDAIIARAGDAQPDPAWSIRIRPATDATPFVLEDDGVGLSAAEVSDLLATVGRSSKRDMLDLRHEDFLGHFGIGLLSCFMVADTIEIVSRRDGELAVVWNGSADGTYTVDELTEAQSDALEVGTRVTLRAGRETTQLVREDKVRALAGKYAEFLPVPVEVLGESGGHERISGPAPFLALDRADAAALAYGERLLDSPPLDSFAIDVPGTATRGMAYVMGRQRSARHEHGARVYLGRMLLSEDERAIVPEWAFFLRIVVSSDLLTPTASRESLVRDDAVEQTREGIARALRAWVEDLARRDQTRLHEFLRVHDYAIRAACVEDDELFAIVGRFLTFETPGGDRTLQHMIATGTEIRYATSLDEYRMLAGMRVRGAVVNASYVHHEELLAKAQVFFADAVIREADVMSLLGALDAPPQQDAARTTRLGSRATAALEGVGVDVVVKVMSDADVPALYVADAKVLARADMERASEVASGPWASALRRAGARLDEVRSRSGDVVTRAQVCLNWRAPLVRHLAGVEDDEVLARAVRLLYVQALLEGRRPLRQQDRALMTRSLDDLITLSVGFGAEGDTSPL